MSDRRDRQASPRQDRPKWSNVIRQLKLQEVPLIAAHFSRLDAQARHDRFGYTASDEAMHAYASRVGADRGVVAGCFADGTLRGVIEVRPTNGWSCYWEGVLTVEPDWQRQGVGLALIDAAFTAARLTGASRVYLRCNVANTNGQHFLARLASTLREDDGDAIATIDLTDPALVTGAMLRSLAPAPRAPATI